MNDQEAWEEISRLEGYVSCLESYGQKHIGQINAARARISVLREQVAREASYGTGKQRDAHQRCCGGGRIGI